MSNAMFLIDQSKELVRERQNNAKKAALAVGEKPVGEDFSHMIGAAWFSPMNGQVIGVVLVNNGFEIKSYIGTCRGGSEIEDARDIAARGAKFPMDSAMALSYSDLLHAQAPSLG